MAIKSFTRSTIENNIFYRSMLAGNTAFSPSSEDILAEEVLTGSQASVTFSSLGDYATAGYQHLQIRVSVRCTRAFATGGLGVQFNSDTGSNYSDHELYGEGSTVASGAGPNSDRIDTGIVAGSTNTANLFSGIVIDILDPFETSKYPTVRSLSGLSGSSSRISLQSGSWRNTNALTDITLYESFGSSNFVSGSRFTLIGLK